MAIHNGDTNKTKTKKKDLPLIPYIKPNPRLIKGLNVKTKTIEILDKIIEEILYIK